LFLLGYRIKLNFDGYSHDYDFWVNADCQDIFYPRWCEQNSRTLQPPKNYKKSFNWDSYTKEYGVSLASKWNFFITKNLSVSDENFNFIAIHCSNFPIQN